MSQQLLFDFQVDKSNNTIKVRREFAAPREKVWAAWTQAELLDQWWAPKPYKAKTKEMDFREGGHWLYAMVSPEGVEHWCRADYEKVQPQEEFAALDAFTNPEGVVDTSHPRSHWTNRFSDSDSRTLVDILIRYNSAEDMAKILEMGFQGGFTMGMNNLDELLSEKS